MTKKKEISKIARDLRKSAGYPYVEAFKLAKKIYHGKESMYAALSRSKCVTHERHEPFYCCSCSKYHFPSVFIGRDGKRFEFLD